MFRKTLLAVCGLALIAVVGAVAQNSACNVLNCQEQGGSRWSIGGSLDIISGGDLDVESGATLKIAGTDKTAALAAAVAAPVAGVAASYKVARGETALDGTNPTDVATGLTTIVACTATIKTTSAPGLGTHVITYSTATATLSLYGWKPTHASDTTLVASTGTDTIGWICVGT